MFEIILSIFFLIISYLLFSIYLSSSRDKPFVDSLSYEKSQPKFCVSIQKPGGFKELKIIPITKPSKGANISYEAAYKEDGTLAEDYLVIKTYAIGVNYADIIIRWGLYESANKYVGLPITPGFEFSGIVEEVSEKSSKFKKGDKVFGVTMFGGYSSHILVNEIQVFHVPSKMTMEEAAGFPCVAFTAYYAIFELFKFKKTENHIPRVLVHSAAGGVGSMLVQLSKIQGAMVVGVVGDSKKVKDAKLLGCSHVIDKSRTNLWQNAEYLAKPGYNVIFDANGVETLSESYNHLSAEGKLVVYGFHTMLPKAGVISIFNWICMGWNYLKTPKFNPLKMTSDNKSVLCFNLSFLFDRKDIIRSGMNKLIQWIEEDKIKVPNINTYKFYDVSSAHQFLQSGKSIGKIILVIE